MSVPLKFTEEARARYIAALKTGAPKRLAAEYAGISVSSARLWLEKGEAAVEAEESGSTLTPVGREFADFYRMVTMEESGKAVEWAGLVEKLGRWTQDWRAIAWLLEKRFPNDYGRGTGGNGEEGLNVQHVIRLERADAPAVEPPSATSGFDPDFVSSGSSDFGVNTDRTPTRY